MLDVGMWYSNPIHRKEPAASSLKAVCIMGEQEVQKRLCRVAETKVIVMKKYKLNSALRMQTMGNRHNKQ
jgi:hypothetical protein